MANDQKQSVGNAKNTEHKKEKVVQERKLILLAEDEDLGRARDTEHHPVKGKYFRRKQAHEDA